LVRFRQKDIKLPSNEQLYLGDNNEGIIEHDGTDLNITVTGTSAKIDISGDTKVNDRLGIAVDPSASYRVFSRDYNSETSGNQHQYYFDCRISPAGASSAQNRGFKVYAQYEGGGNHTGNDFTVMETEVRNASSYNMTYMTGIRNYVYVLAGKTVNYPRGTYNEVYLRGNTSVAYGTYNYVYAATATANVTSIRSSYNQAANTAAVTVDDAIGSYNFILNHSTGSITEAIGSKSFIQNTSTGSITDAYGFWFDASSNGTITNMYGFYMDSTITGSVNPANLYGLYISDISGEGNTVYGVYIADNVDNYFGGDIFYGANISGAGNIYAGNFYGNGSGLSNINAVQIQGRNISSDAPTDGQALAWNNGLSQWEPQTISGTTVSGIDKWPTEAHNTGVTLTTGDFGKTITIDSASDQIAYLPSVDSGDEGAWFRFVKQGAGRVTISGADSDTIADSSAGGTIYDDVSDETWATLTLQLVSGTQWVITGAHGSWITT
jgi:hypothetical protein